MHARPKPPRQLTSFKMLDPTLSLSRLSDSQPLIAHEHQVKVARPSHVRFVEERPWLSNNA